MESKTKVKRNMGLEWLRICSMLMIILLHSIDHSGLLEELTSGTPLYYYEYFLYALLQVCVNCFVLISGYFLVNSRFRPEKLVSLWGEVVFYSLVIKIIMMFLGEIPFSLTSLISCFAPILTGRYWFVTIYFGMYLLSPFYNIAIKAMNKKQHSMLLVLLFVLSSVMISIHPSFKGMNSGGGWGLAWFSVLYFMSAYIRYYYDPKGDYKKSLIVFLLCPAVMVIALFVAQKLENSILIAIVENLWRYDSVPAFIASLALFLLFLNCNISGKSNGVIIRISSTTFGIYLIHAHANMCTEEMWQRIGMTDNMGAWWFPLYQIVLVVGIFLICSALEYVRQSLFSKLKVDLYTKKTTDMVLNKWMLRRE